MRIMKKLLATAVLYICAGSAYAAQDGTLGATSEGSLDVTFGISEVVRISHLNDLAFGIYDGSGDEKLDDDICIYTNDAAADYNITITGEGTGGAFEVSNGVEDMPFSVKWNDETGTSGSDNITSGVVLIDQEDAHTTSTDCVAGTELNANVEVKFVAADLDLAIAGAYSGEITLLVEPN